MKLKNYWEPTPKFARALGDVLLSIGTLITAYNITMNEHTYAMIVLFSSVIGKFLTNFYTEENQDGI